MALDNESFNKQLYDLLKTRGYKPVSKNARNQDVTASQEADVIEFQFIKDGENYGKAWVTIDNASTVILYYDNDIEDSPEGRTPGAEYDDSWSGFKKHLSSWAQRKQLDFELSNKDRLSDDMRQREYVKMKEKVNEGYYPMGKQASYNDSVPTVKIILQHTRQIQEGEQRFRNIAKIFLENQLGERILAPTTRPGIAQVYARHLAEGGVPNDDRWNHIKGLCEEYNSMAGFVRATKNKQFNESAQPLINEGINHYNNLRETLSKMRGHRGYNAYFESYTPTLMETDGDENLNELFVQETLDPRIESVMPILSRLRKNLGEMSEVKALESWANDIISEKMDSTTKSLAVPADEMLDEAPGAETLSHNQNTEKSNLKAFDLDEEESNERPYICVHAKKGKCEVKASSSYGAAQKAAQKWGLKSTAGIDAYLADIKHSTASLGEAEQSPEEKLTSALKKIEARIASEQNPQLKMKLTHKKEEIEAALKQLKDQPKPATTSSSNNPLSRLKPEVDDAGKSSGGNDENFWKAVGKLAIGLGEEEELDEGMMKHKMHADAEKMSLEEFLEKYAHHEEDKGWLKEFWRDSNGGEEVDEGLDANQKRVGQLGPTEKVGPKGAVGKLVGANESKLNEMDSEGYKGHREDGDPYAKGGKATPSKAKDTAKDAEKVLNKSMDKEHKKEVKEGQEDLDAILRIIRK